MHHKRGSIPNRFLGNFQVTYSFCPHSVALWSTLHVMSTKEFPWGQSTATYSWQLYHPSCADVKVRTGAQNSIHLWIFMACYGKALTCVKITIGNTYKFLYHCKPHGIHNIKCMEFILLSFLSHCRSIFIIVVVISTLCICIYSDHVSYPGLFSVCRVTTCCWSIETYVCHFSSHELLLF